MNRADHTHDWHRVSWWAITQAQARGRVQFGIPVGKRQWLRNTRTGAIYDFRLLRCGAWLRRAYVVE